MVDLAQDRYNIHVGHIYEITTDNFFTSHKDGYHRETKIRKGEKIEIRYPYEWHFRTEDNEYFHCTAEMIKENSSFFGKILGEVRFQNKATLEEILRLKLYKKKFKQDVQ